MLMGIIVMAFLIGDLSNIMSNLDPVANEFKQTLDNLNDYMHRSGFDNDLRLKLREYIMLSEPCFRDHFNKEMLTKLSPTLISVVARKKMGHVVEKIPFYAHTVQRTGGYPKGQRVLVHDRAVDDEEPSVGRPALVLRSPSLLRYDVQFDDGEIQKNVRHTHIEPPPLPPDLLHLRRGEIQRLHFQRDLFLSKVASLFTTRLFMTFDVIVHKDLSLNDVMYVIEHGKVCCLNYDARKTFGISVKQDDEFIGDDIAMLARSPCPSHDAVGRFFLNFEHTGVRCSRKNIEALFLSCHGGHPDARVGCHGLLSSTGAGAGPLAVLQALPDVGLLAAVKSRFDAEWGALGEHGAHGRGWY